MKTEIKLDDGSIAPSSVVVPDDAQLFDVIWELKNDDSGGYNAYLLMARLWVQNPAGYELHFQLRLFNGAADGHLKAMREYGFIQ